MSYTNTEISHLIIDWGTTNFRAFAINNVGAVLDIKELPLGLLQVKDGNFAKELEHMLLSWLGDFSRLPIYMAGMVGSAKGWVNVSYVTTPATTHNVVAGVHQFTLPWGAKAHIIPGISHQFSHDSYDVMRGEEVQIFGLAALLGKTTFTAILPGTHSKHLRFEEGKIQQFSTFMTGELFSIISNYSLLGRGLDPHSNSSDDTAFIRGVRESQGNPLSRALFMVWTHRLFKNVSELDAMSYLSGLLIGAELEQCDTKHVYLVGGEANCIRYQLACEELGVASSFVSGNDCFLAGMGGLISEVNKRV